MQRICSVILILLLMLTPRIAAAFTPPLDTHRPAPSSEGLSLSPTASQSVADLSRLRFPTIPRMIGRSAVTAIAANLVAAATGFPTLAVLAPLLVAKMATAVVEVRRAGKIAQHNANELRNARVGDRVILQAQGAPRFLGIRPSAVEHVVHEVTAENPDGTRELRVVGVAASKSKRATARFAKMMRLPVVPRDQVRAAREPATPSRPAQPPRGRLFTSAIPHH